MLTCSSVAAAGKIPDATNDWVVNVQGKIIFFGEIDYHCC